MQSRSRDGLVWAFLLGATLLGARWAGDRPLRAPSPPLVVDGDEEAYGDDDPPRLPRWVPAPPRIVFPEGEEP